MVGVAADVFAMHVCVWWWWWWWVVGGDVWAWKFVNSGKAPGSCPPLHRFRAGDGA